MVFRLCLLLFLFPIIAFSYTVVRKDGKTFQGELLQQSSDGISIKDKDGTVIKFKSSQIDWDKTTNALREEEKERKDHDQIKLMNFETREIGKRPRRNQWIGEPISVDFKDVDVRDFFRFIAEIAKTNLIIDPAIKGTLTMKMVDVPWDQVLDVVCRNYGWGYEIDGNVVSINH